MMMTFIYVLALFFLLVLVFFFRRFIYERDDDGESEKSDTGNTFLFKLGTQPNRNKDINYKNISCYETIQFLFVLYSLVGG